MNEIYDSELDVSFDGNADSDDISGSDVSQYRSSESDEPNEPVFLSQVQTGM